MLSQFIAALAVLILSSARRSRHARMENIDEIDIHAEPTTEILCLPGPKWFFDWPSGGFAVGTPPVPLHIGVVANSGLGTGLTVWDGAIVLSKYLENEARVAAERGEVGLLSGRVVLELGAGTGVVGLAAAALGARRTYLTDQAYTLEYLRRTVSRNSHLSGVEVMELDWYVSTVWARARRLAYSSFAMRMPSFHSGTAHRRDSLALLTRVLESFSRLMSFG